MSTLRVDTIQNQAGTGPASTITISASQNSTSGTSIDFTSIPSGVKCITIMFKDVSTSGTSVPIVQIGDSGGIETSGYTGSTSQTTNVALSAITLSAGFAISTNSAAASTFSGAITLTLLNAETFTWTASGIVGFSNAAGTGSVGGHKVLTAELDRVRITATNGTDTFDSGVISISYEA
jgi:hypothetical protein